MTVFGLESVKQRLQCLQFSSKGRRHDTENKVYNYCVNPIWLISVQIIHLRLLDHKSICSLTVVLNL